MGLCQKRICLAIRLYAPGYRGLYILILRSDIAAIQDLLYDVQTCANRTEEQFLKGIFEE